MDIARVLDYLTSTGRLLPGEDWGPGSNTDSTYTALVSGWRGVSTVPTQAEMDAAWEVVQAIPPRPPPGKVAAALIVRNSSGWPQSDIIQTTVQDIIDQAVPQALEEIFGG
ncbi:MAG: hypothetical protein V4532_06110 [Pseudomonadota bacterium]